VIDVIMVLGSVKITANCIVFVWATKFIQAFGNRYALFYRAGSLVGCPLVRLFNIAQSLKEPVKVFPPARQSQSHDNSPVCESVIFADTGFAHKIQCLSQSFKQ
jgi:hypothetical protein